MKLAGRIPSQGFGPFALIIAPTRELTQQLGDTALAFTRGC